MDTPAGIEEVGHKLVVHGEERKGARDGRTYVVCGTPEVHHVGMAVVRGKTTEDESSVGGRAEEETREEARDRAHANHGTRVHRGYAEVRAVVRAFTRWDRWIYTLRLSGQQTNRIDSETNGAEVDVLNF